MSRVLAVDYGLKRMGIALSDPTRTIASPHTTLVRRPGKRPPWTELMRLIEENDVNEVVIGLPLDLAGNEGDWAAEVREFGSGLARRCELPIHWIDERMTSVQAERAVRGSGLKKKQREEKARVDAAAAALILQAYLQQRTR